MRRLYFFAIAATLLGFAADASAQISLGNPLRVNTTTTGEQTRAPVSNAPDGSFVVVWQSQGAPGDPTVRAQRFDALGQSVGGEILVNLTAVGASANPVVAVDAAGSFLVTWAGTPGALDIRARLFRRTGVAVGGERLLNLDTVGDQDLPAVAALANGFVVLWSTHDHCDLHGRLLDRDGQTISSELAIDGLQPCQQLGATVAPAADGGFVAAWTAQGLGDPDYGVAARRFDAAGNPLDAAFLVPSEIAGVQAEPSVAADSAGNFVVTWTEGDELSAAPLPDVRAQRFDASGARVGEVFRVHGQADGAQSQARAAMDSTGGFAIAWASVEAGDSTNTGLFAQAYASSGATVVSGSLLNLLPQSLRTEPDIAMDAGGDFAVVGTGSDGPSSNGIFVQRFTTPCEVRPTTLCLQGGRFKVEAAWRTNQGANGLARGVTLSGDTGYFWFFNSANVEMVVKVLPGCPVNSSYWVFAGGLTNVEVELIVTDTQTGLVKRYQNPASTAFQPIQDTTAFPSCSPGGGNLVENVAGASSPTPSSLGPLLAELEQRVAEASAPDDSPLPAVAGGCVTTATRLCLRDGRFAVEVDWQKPNGESGQGKAVSLTGDTGYFWFFNSANVELVLKVLPGCPVNSRYWVFAGGLTNVRVVMRVTDTRTGLVKTYINPVSTRFQPIQDTEAFATCP